MPRTHAPTGGGLRLFLLPAAAALAVCAALLRAASSINGGDVEVAGWTLLASIFPCAVLAFVAAKKWASTLPKSPDRPFVVVIEEE